VQDPQRSWDLWRRRHEKSEPTPPRTSPVVLDYVVPALMALAGIAVLLTAFHVEGAGPAVQLTLYVLLAVAGTVSIGATIFGLASVRWYYDLDYGPTSSALVKAVGLVLLVDSLWLLGSRWHYPVTSWLVLAPVASLLVMWLYGQKGWDAVITIVALFVIRLVLFLLLVLTVLSLSISEW
jgi:hypothetical protein